MRRLFPVFASLALGGCVVAHTSSPYPPSRRVEVVPPLNPYPPPPPPRVEAAPPPPRETLVWEPGRWHWDGRGYVWVNGHYVERQVGRHWEPGKRRWDGHNWEWVGGHWS
jgi:hypothetical protein